MSKKITAIILALAALLSLAACGSSTAPEQSAAPAQENTAQENAAQEMRIVTDTWGRKVEIPYTVESIICLGSGAPRMAAYLDVVDMMVGVEDHDKEAYNILRDYNPRLPRRDKGSARGRFGRRQRCEQRLRRGDNHGRA